MKEINWCKHVKRPYTKPTITEVTLPEKLEESCILNMKISHTINKLIDCVKWLMDKEAKR